MAPQFTNSFWYEVEPQNGATEVEGRGPCLLGVSTVGGA